MSVKRKVLDVQEWERYRYKGRPAGRRAYLLECGHTEQRKLSDYVVKSEEMQCRQCTRLRQSNALSKSGPDSDNAYVLERWDRIGDKLERLVLNGDDADKTWQKWCSDAGFSQWKLRTQ